MFGGKLLSVKGRYLGKVRGKERIVMANIGVIGAGSWGIALSVLLSNNGHDVKVWSIIEEEIRMLSENHEHKDKLPGVKLSEKITFTTDLKEAVEGKETDALFYMAEIQEAMGDSQAAEESITAYIESGKLDSYHLFQVANGQIAKGHYEMAIECLNQALALDSVPNKQMIMKSLVIAYEQNRDFETAQKILEEYVEIYPDDEDAKRELTFLETR